MRRRRSVPRSAARPSKTQQGRRRAGRRPRRCSCGADPNEPEEEEEEAVRERRERDSARARRRRSPRAVPRSPVAPCGTPMPHRHEPGAGEQEQRGDDRSRPRRVPKSAATPSSRIPSQSAIQATTVRCHRAASPQRTWPTRVAAKAATPVSRKIQAMFQGSSRVPPSPVDELERASRERAGCRRRRRPHARPSRLRRRAGRRTRRARRATRTGSGR